MFSKLIDDEVALSTNHPSATYGHSYDANNVINSVLGGIKAYLVKTDLASVTVFHYIVWLINIINYA